MAPELMSVGKCTEKADIFSFGVVLYEILTGARPIRGRMKPVKYAPLLHCCSFTHEVIAQSTRQFQYHQQAATFFYRPNCATASDLLIKCSLCKLSDVAYQTQLTAIVC